MMLLPSFLDGLARTVSTKKGKSVIENDGGREIAEAMAKDAKKNALMIRSSSGVVGSENSKRFAAVSSKRGEKGINQDRAIVWEEFGCEEDMMFCGIFDGHGPWGHVIAKTLTKSFPSSLLCHYWQHSLISSSSSPFDLWTHSCLKTFAAVDLDLKLRPSIDSFRSGSTALTAILQGDDLVIANAGDSRAILATVSEFGDGLVPVQLSVDCKPNISAEAERIVQSGGRIFCLEDEPGLYRLWMPSCDSPGLAVSRAFGDYCVKDFGLISVPDVTYRRISGKDQFLILATDGVWDVVSNEEAIEIVSSSSEKTKAAKNLVQRAVRNWKRKRRGIAVDDISAICLFFHP